MNFVEISKNKDFTTYLSSSHSSHACIFWWPQVEKSISPFMHNYMSFVQWSDLLYTQRVVEEEQTFEEAFGQMAKDTRYVWGNVTMPYKLDAYAYFQKNGKLDTSAKIAWAINTIVREWNTFVWYNTDIAWLQRPLEKTLISQSKTDHAYVLWAWWAARAIIVALHNLWYHHITVFNRTAKRVEDMIDYMGKSLHNTQILYAPYTQTWLQEHIISPGLVINTLPFGFDERFQKYPIHPDSLTSTAQYVKWYFDIVYHLEQPDTPLVTHIKKYYPHIPTRTWLDMVVNQAKQWFEMRCPGYVFDVNLMKNILLNKS